MRGAKEAEGSPVLFPLAHPSTGVHNQVLRSVGADVPYCVFKAMATHTPISGLVLRNAHCGTLIPFPKDHSDASTRELGEKSVPTSTTQEEEYKAVGLSSFFKKSKQFLATTLGSGQLCSTPSRAGVGGQSSKPWSFASVNSSRSLL